MRGRERVSRSILGRTFRYGQIGICSVSFVSAITYTPQTTPFRGLSFIRDAAQSCN